MLLRIRRPPSAPPQTAQSGESEVCHGKEEPAEIKRLHLSAKFFIRIQSFNMWSYPLKLKQVACSPTALKQNLKIRSIKISGENMQAFLLCRTVHQAGFLYFLKNKHKPGKPLFTFKSLCVLHLHQPIALFFGQHLYNNGIKVLGFKSSDLKWPAPPWWIKSHLLWGCILSLSLWGQKDPGEGGATKTQNREVKINLGI